MYFIIFKLYDLSMSQSELSRRTGISTSTINDWEKKKINPQADKLLVICRTLDMSLAELLGDDGDESSSADYSAEEKYLIECYRRSDNHVRKHMLRYMELIDNAETKAKANAAQAIPEIIEIATSKTVEENKKEKHSHNAKNGWYRYDTRFALPVYDESGEGERYNVFSVRLLIRHAASGKMYLYDVLEIKKETSKPCQV